MMSIRGDPSGLTASSFNSAAQSFSALLQSGNFKLGDSISRLSEMTGTKLGESTVRGVKDGHIKAKGSGNGIRTRNWCTSPPPLPFSSSPSPTSQT